MSKIYVLFTSVILLFLMGCSDNTAQKKLRIGVSIPAATHGWAGGVVWSAQQAKKNLEKNNPDVEVLLASSKTSADQVSRIENLLARKVDALVVMSQEPGPITGICERAKKQGVFLVIVSNPLEKQVQDVFVNGDNRSFGEAAAHAMGSLLKGQGNILVMEGIPCPINSDRVGSFRKVLKAKYPAIRILDSQSAYWNTEKGLLLMEVYLQKFKKIDAVWAGDDDVLLGALKACKESARKEIRFMVGGGGSKQVVKMIMDKDPLVHATVTYSPRMLEVGVNEALKGLRNGKKAVQKEIIIPSRIVTRSNAKEFYYPDSVY
ncbi:MAG: substrate-binding domain-containing protein [Lentisphaeria bacterium]|nr:substrate-binding domain-containing protein [Lentisphaeria bacterium]